MGHNRVGGGVDIAPYDTVSKTHEIKQLKKSYFTVFDKTQCVQLSHMTVTFREDASSTKHTHTLVFPVNTLFIAIWQLRQETVAMTI